MCGRFALAESPRDMADFFDIEPPLLEPRYNVAPAQTALVLVREPERRAPEFQGLFWGLVPFWAKDAAMATRLVNARAETASEKRAFRAAFRHRRCLVPVSGFYEWRREGKGRTPYFFSARRGGMLALAGVWEDWSMDDRYVRSFSILTSDANAVMRPVHDRMPVVLPPEAWARWLDPDLQRPEELADLLAPADPGMLRKCRVGSFVNKVGNDGPECVREVPEAEGQGRLPF